MNKVVMPNKIDIPNFNTEIYENVGTSFTKSISINRDIESNIKNIYRKFLENSGKTILNYYNLKYFEMYELLCQNSDNTIELEKLSKYITKTFNDFFRR